MTHRNIIHGLVIGILLPFLPARGAPLLTQQEALKQAFPNAEIARRVVALTADQMKTASTISGVKIPGPLVILYEASKDGHLIGTAYFDVQRVHSLPQTLMIVVGPDKRLKSVTVLDFKEPSKFMAPAAWMQQFSDRALDDQLQLRRGIDGITGATLTARSTIKSARLVLAIHAVLSP